MTVDEKMRQYKSDMRKILDANESIDLRRDVYQAINNLLFITRKLKNSNRETQIANLLT